MRAQDTFWIAAGLALVIVAGTTWLHTGWQSGAAIGSSLALRPEFRLEDPTGRVVTQNDFRGQFLLVLFGFTRCPEVCPTTLSKVGDIMEALGEDADQVQPLFISVDPERDAANLDDYTATFHPSILGLTGSSGSILLAAESFRVFYDRHDDPTASDDYEMEHSSSLFLLGPDGTWLRAFQPDTSAAMISADLLGRLE